MALFIVKSLYIILIGSISHLLILPVTASPQFGTDFTLPAPLGGDSTTQQDATPPQPNPTTPDALLPPLADDAQWSSSQTQNPDLLAQAQPQSLDNLNTDDIFDPSSLIGLNPAADDTQTTNSQSNLASASCSANTNPKPGATRLLRRGYGEAQPCCDPVNLGLDNPWNWVMGQDHVETRSPYCCQGKPYEYARQLLCVPWEKDHEWCQDRDNWACCIYGGSIFNGKVYATHCWSYFPPPVKVPEPAGQQH